MNFHQVLLFLGMVDKNLLVHIESYLTKARREKFLKVLSQRTNHFTVATEDVYQLHNTSAVIRSCDVFGIQNVHIVEELNTKKIDREIAMGAQKWVDLHRYNTVTDCLAKLRQKGYQIVATTPHSNGVVLEDFDVVPKSCFFFGRETEGLTDAVLNAADVHLKIPMVGFTESLNISVSAAIILQVVTSKLKTSNVAWQLNNEEQLQKRLDWCRKTIKNYKALEDMFYALGKKPLQ